MMGQVFERIAIIHPARLELIFETRPADCHRVSINMDNFCLGKGRMYKPET